MQHSYKLVIAYDGTAYHGWQRQKEYCSIDSVVRQTFLRSFCQKELLLVGASRTDAGVHARGQVIRLRTYLPLCPLKLSYVLDRALPPDIKIISCEKVNQIFHPQHNVATKTYSYSLTLKKLLPTESRYSWLFPYCLNPELLEQALQVFVGTHDFQHFCKESKTGKSTIKTIESVSVVTSPCKNRYTLLITGPSFLRYMIRRMVGAACVVASSSEVSVNDLKNKLAGKTSSVKLLITAPAHGLCLESITYHVEK